MKTQNLVLGVLLSFALMSCSDADTVSGNYNGTFNASGNGTYSGYFDVSSVGANTINIQPGGSFGQLPKVENIAVTKSGSTYNLKSTASSNVPYLTGYVSNNSISCTYTYGGNSSYTFNGAK